MVPAKKKACKHAQLQAYRSLFCVLVINDNLIIGTNSFVKDKFKLGLDDGLDANLGKVLTPSGK